MEEEGLVVENRGRRAVVEIERQSACKKCEHSCGLAGDSHEIDEIEVEVSNPIGAQTGERVILEMEDRQVYFASIMIYLFPPIFMILGYFLFMNMGEILFGPQHELMGIFGAFVLFVISLAGLRKLDNRLKKNSKFDPEIIARVDSDNSDRRDREFS